MCQCIWWIHNKQKKKTNKKETKEQENKTTNITGL